MIFQRFDLNEEALNDKIENEEVKVNFPEASRELIKRLCEKNYQVMHTMNYVNGVPTQIIIGSGVHAGLDHKTDFYELCEELGLQVYGSGEFYIADPISDNKAAENETLAITGGK